MTNQSDRWLRFLPTVLVISGFVLLGAYFVRRAVPPPSLTAVQPVTSEAGGLAAVNFVTMTAAANVQAPATDRPIATRTSQPIIPTRTAVPAAHTTMVTAAPVSLTPQPSLSTTGTVQVTPGPTPIPTVTMLQVPPPGDPIPAIGYRERFGVTGSEGTAINAHAAGLAFGGWLNWNINAAPSRPGGAHFWQMIRVQESGLVPSWDSLAAVIDAQPGAIWLIGNEPDVKWQDNTTPQRYATLYHDAYTFIKARDPGARVAIGGVSQPTPLRRAYLDIVLDTYQVTYGRPMPVDIWNIHAFILREEADSWGVDIPPGMGDDAAIRYEIDHHADMVIFRQNLVDFRAWMAQRGYGERPLVVSEYGILLPEDYGFPPEIVADFIRDTFDFFLTAANETGYPAENGRLVQWWFWYSLYDGSDYPTGNLYAPQTGQLTLPGQAFAEYAGR